MKSTNIDRIIAIFITITCIIVMVTGLNMRGGAGIMPITFAIIGMITSLLLLTSTYTSAEEPVEFDAVPWHRFVLLCIFIISLLVSMEIIGSLIAIPAFLFICFLVLARLTITLALIISISFTCVIYFAFVFLLEVPLPSGFIATWLDNL